MKRLILSLFAVLLFPTVALAAPRLYLDPATATASAGGTATIKLMIDTDSQEAAAADAKITFPGAIIEGVSVATGTFFENISKTISNQTGTIDIHGYFSATTTKSGTGVVATLTFKGVAPGVAAVNLACTAGSTTDSNIANTSGQDIINCATTTGSELTVNAAGGDIGGSTILTPTPTPSLLPQAGGITPTIGLLGIGILTIIIGFGSGTWILTRN